MADLIDEDEIARLMEAFTLHDKDKDGLISTAELGQVLHTLGQNPTEAELQDLAYAMDTNDSGTIDFPGIIFCCCREILLCTIDLQVLQFEAP